MEITPTTAEPRGAIGAVAQLAVPRWDPQFARALRDAHTAVQRAQIAMRDPNHHDVGEPEAIREAAGAVQQLHNLMADWEDIPNGLLDAIDGALHECTAAAQVLKDAKTQPNRHQLVDEAGLRLQTAEQQLRELIAT